MTGIKATIVMPETAPLAKVTATKSYGAEVVLNGASEYEAKELLCNNIKAELNGASMMKISVTDLLDVEVNGAGEVSYYGSPEVKSDVHGAGKVKQKSEDPYC